MTGRGPTARPFGDAAVLVTTGGVRDAQALARAVEAHRRLGTAPVPITDLVVGWDSVLAVLGGPDPDPAAAGAWLEATAAAPAGGPPVVDRGGRVHVLPVAFDGPDLEEVAARCGLAARAVVDRLTAARLEVALVGFAPGFPYLTGLPPELAAVPRRATPRTSVPAGSVALAGGFAAVYPQATPGGWHLLGRTPVRLFDPTTPPFARVAPGDVVRFEVADGLPGGADPAAPRPALGRDRGTHLEVVAPGVLTLVQDAGRRGVGALGVPAAGAADPEAFALVQELLGNDRRSAALECTAIGPTLVATGPVHLAVVGAGPGAVDLRVDGRPVDDAAVVPVDAGQVVAVGPVRRGLRAYLGVSGGFDTPDVLGSRASDVLCGLGPGPLRAGDRLPVGAGARPRALLSWPGSGRDAAPGPRPPTAVVRVLDGPHPVPPGVLETLADTVWRVRSDSDRVGLRLEADDATTLTGAPPVASTGMVTGAVQLPPDGRPIVLLPDHATVGGYPVAACVIVADLPVLGRLAPGDALAFARCGPGEARTARADRRHALTGRVAGWYPTAAAT